MVCGGFFWPFYKQKAERVERRSDGVSISWVWTSVYVLALGRRVEEEKAVFEWVGVSGLKKRGLRRCGNAWELGCGV